MDAPGECVLVARHWDLDMTCKGGSFPKGVLTLMYLLGQGHPLSTSLASPIKLYLTASPIASPTCLSGCLQDNEMRCRMTSWRVC
jgi:hypothetical protein